MFFYGTAGPETAVGVQFAKRGQRYKTDQRLTIKGTFRTNFKEFNHLIYFLKNVEVVK
jgi:hypothetical protein